MSLVVEKISISTKRTFCLLREFGAEIVCAISSISLRMYIPLTPYYGAGHDDELQVSLASRLLEHQWLGEYSDLGHRTLAKPPGYPIFLYFVHHIPVASSALVQLIIVIAAFWTMQILREYGVNTQVSKFGYLITIFCPIWFGTAASRVYRDYFLTALVLVSIVIALKIGLVINKGNSSQPIFKKRSSNWFLLIIAGLVLSLVSITKSLNYGPFFFVSFVVVVVLSQSELKKRAKIFNLIFALVMIFSSSQVINAMVSSANYKKYGVFMTDSFTQGSFPRAMNLIGSISDRNPRPYVVVSKSMRDKMYLVSPTAVKLRTFLETAENTGWKSASCSSPLHVCDESTAWFPWEIRDAVESAGLGDNALEFEDTFKKIANEIDEACRNQKIACGNKGPAPGVNSLSETSKRRLVESISDGLTGLYNLRGSGGSSSVYSADATPDQIKLWRETVNGLPKNTPLDTYNPGVLAGADTSQLVLIMYKKFWDVWILLGFFGLLISVLKERVKILNTIGLGATGAFLLMLCQLALIDAQSGLYIKGSSYFLPLYPFMILAATIGVDRTLAMFKARQKSHSLGT